MIFTNIGDRFQVEKRLGKGSFGEVHLALDDVTKTKVAVKIGSYAGQIEMREEINMYKKLEGVEGVPRILVTGKHRGRDYVAMELLGKDLWDICEVTLSEKDVLLVAYKSISILQRIHQRGIIHRDLKPENLMIGSDNKNDLYIMDFGLAKSYLKANGEHEDYGIAHVVGTAEYASLNCHKRRTQSRADDLESLAYTLLFLLQGSLPWQNGRCNFHNVYPEKAASTPYGLFHGHSVAFARLLTHARTLAFKDEPDYSYLMDLFENELKKLGSNVDDSFDFNKEPEPKISPGPQENTCTKAAPLASFDNLPSLSSILLY